MIEQLWWSEVKSHLPSNSRASFPARVNISHSGRCLGPEQHSLLHIENPHWHTTTWKHKHNDFLKIKFVFVCCGWWRDTNLIHQTSNLQFKLRQSFMLDFKILGLKGLSKVRGVFYWFLKVGFSVVSDKSLITKYFSSFSKKLKSHFLLCNLDN